MICTPGEVERSQLINLMIMPWAPHALSHLMFTSVSEKRIVICPIFSDEETAV